ncbi:sugar transporter [Sulfuricaulis limicola]|uniref:Sugar transporter n=1 Tax=Sulfuricaulis limicola TaxID=1620215 RepID=A0A1B4XGK0_9GAMM|nr:polysaccharide biosynthesis/export family protein [Sulfuricaulis limicola]BAV33897.1 sugar transporter [Sulfuricaulis limicola]
MQRLNKLFQFLVMILAMAALVSCGTAPSAVASDMDNTGSASAPGIAAPGAAAGAKTAPETAPRDAYIIQPGDILAVSVWKEKDLQGEYAVRPDGGINFPLAGDIVVAGKTIEQIQVTIAAKLTKYVPDPVVTASVKQSQGNKIYVVGKVNKPGEFASNRTIDVMQALSMAGGPNPFASVNKIKIIRRVNGEQKIFYFKYSRVEKGEDLEQNIILQGGDIVVVP